LDHHHTPNIYNSTETSTNFNSMSKETTTPLRELEGTHLFFWDIRITLEEM